MPKLDRGCVSPVGSLHGLSFTGARLSRSGRQRPFSCEEVLPLGRRSGRGDAPSQSCALEPEDQPRVSTSRSRSRTCAPESRRKGHPAVANGTDTDLAVPQKPPCFSSRGGRERSRTAFYDSRDSGANGSLMSDSRHQRPIAVSYRAAQGRSKRDRSRRCRGPGVLDRAITFGSRADALR